MRTNYCLLLSWVYVYEKNAEFTVYLTFTKRSNVYSLHNIRKDYKAVGNVNVTGEATARGLTLTQPGAQGKYIRTIFYILHLSFN